MNTVRLVTKLFIVMGIICALIIGLTVASGDVGELPLVIGIIVVVTSLIAFRVAKTSVKQKLK